MVSVPPTDRAISVHQARDWSKTTSTSDDTNIDLLIESAVGELESYTSRKLMSQTVKWIFDGYPDGHYIELPIGDGVTSVTSVKYYTTADSLETFFDEISSDSLEQDFETVPNRLILKQNKSWPTDIRPAHSWEITFVAGASAASSVDPRLRSALLKMVASQVDSGRTNDRIDPALHQSALLEISDLKTHW